MPVKVNKIYHCMQENRESVQNFKNACKRLDKFVLKCTLFQWKRIPYWFGIFCTAKLSIKSKKSQEEKTSKQKQNSHPFLEIKAINSVFLLEIADTRIDYCTPLKKKNMQEAKTKLKQIYLTYKSKN